MIYEIGGLRVLIKNRGEYTNRLCKEYLSPDQNSPCDVVAEASKEAFLEEKASSPNYSDGYIENICLYRNLCLQMPSFDRFLLHAAVLSYHGNGYAFLGKSGAGKSTHTGLWLKYLDGAKIINGDKPIVRFDEKDFYAYGTPWLGKEGRGCNDSVKIKAVCFIEQAKENSIRRLSVSEFTDRIFSQLLLPTDEENVQKTLFMVDKLVVGIPAYVLQCDISEEAVRVSFEEMTGEKYNDKEF